MRRNLEWFYGAPEKIEPGMILRYPEGQLSLVGGMAGAKLPYCGDAIAWAWLVTPAELEWLEAMAKTNAKSRPEQ